MGGKTGRRLVLLVALVAACLTLAAPAGAQPRSRAHASAPTSPAYENDFPDPFVLLDNGVYWAYSTGSAGLDLQVIRSTDLVTWSEPEEPLQGLPSWATKGFTWAPAVTKVGSQFVMYYTLRHTASGRQCISVAIASSPGGPFVDHSSGPLVCQLDHWGSIDASPFMANGTRYLLWKSDDNAVGARTNLWAQPLSSDGRRLTGRPTRLLSQVGSWQSPAIEGPSMMATSTGFVLFYGAGDWASAQAGIGWARCTTPLGPCTDQSLSGAWLGSQPNAQGPSGPATFTDMSGATRFAYHAWTGAVGYPHGARSLFITTLTFTTNGTPALG